MQRNRNQLVLALGLTFAAASQMASAQVFVSNTSIDGPGTDLQTQLTAHGIGSSVANDQVMFRTFRRSTNAPMTISTLFTYAAYAPNHEVGYYDAKDPNHAITYVMGGSNTGLSDTGSFSFNGEFGMALKSPDGVFMSETGLNDDLFNHLVVLKDRDSGGNIVQNSYILAWEDLKFGGDKDYNDRVYRVTNANPVPEPTTIAGIGAGAVAMIRKRKNRKSK